MKKLILIPTLLLTTTLFAQQHLPAKAGFVLTDKQIMRIDSAINLMANQLDSKQATSWFTKSFEPIYTQVRKQLITVIDSSKRRPDSLRRVKQ